MRSTVRARLSGQRQCYRAFAVRMLRQLHADDQAGAWSLKTIRSCVRSHRPRDRQRVAFPLARDANATRESNGIAADQELAVCATVGAPPPPGGERPEPAQFDRRLMHRLVPLVRHRCQSDKPQGLTDHRQCAAHWRTVRRAVSARSTASEQIDDCQKDYRAHERHQHTRQAEIALIDRSNA